MIAKVTDAIYIAFNCIGLCIIMFFILPLAVRLNYLSLFFGLCLPKSIFCFRLPI